MSASRGLKLVLLGVLLVACSTPTPTPHAVLQPTEMASMAEAGPVQGGTMVFPIYQDPGQLNPFLIATGETGLIAKAIYEGLVDIGPNGDYYPKLARELPTRENGGVSQDGLTITWKLRDDVVWSDGEPFTSEDVRFTWEAVTHPESVAQKYSQGWDLIDSLDTPDDHTVVVHYREYYYNYLDQFIGDVRAAILPQHACGDPGRMSEWECNRRPVGTGPFMVEEWKSGESLTLARNPRYREARSPYLDRIVFPIVPDEVMRKEMLRSGEGDAILWLNFEHAEELETAGCQIAPGTDMWLLRMGFNFSKDGDLSVAHPILADKQVRKAIQLAVDPNLLNDGVLNGRGRVVAHELFRGSTKCPDPEIVYSKEEARSLLEAAGWIDQDGDGIRECRGCLYSEEGSRMRMEIITPSDPPSYSRMIQIIADELIDIGIEVSPSTPDDIWERHHSGDYDIAFWDDGYTSDPLGFLGRYYSSSSIPTEGTEGDNSFRFSNKEIDGLLAEVRTIEDSEERLDTFCKIDRVLLEELPSVWLTVMPYPDAFSGRMEGWQFNPNDVMTWDIANWWIRE